MISASRSERGILNTLARDGTVQYRRLIWHVSCYRYYFHLGDGKRCRRMADGPTLMLPPPTPVASSSRIPRFLLMKQNCNTLL